jgi:hypothetical protein
MEAPCDPPLGIIWNPPKSVALDWLHHVKIEPDFVKLKNRLGMIQEDAENSGDPGQGRLERAFHNGESRFVGPFMGKSDCPFGHPLLHNVESHR